ncbi:MAG: DUF4013 domain-containing protein [Candidatus Magnetoovum sp. WYHC-5]|nr:DUF4013 domain-containing protein [Candidatus Magnetoovum sp. WYHC-5]
MEGERAQYKGQKDKFYNIVMTGDVIKGKDINECKTKLSSVFHIPVSKVESYCRGERKVVKKHLDIDKAKKYKQVLIAIGFQCTIEPVKEKALLTKPMIKAKQQDFQRDKHKEIPMAIEDKAKEEAQEEQLEEEPERVRVIHEEFPQIHIPTPKKDETPPPPFFSQIAKVFIYPFIGNGKLLLIAGTLTFFVLSHIPFTKLYGQLLVSGYMIAYMMKIITSSAKGEKELPDWPDFTDITDDIIRPIFMMIAAIVVSNIPTIAYAAYKYNVSSIQINDPILLTLPFIGTLYFPMSLITMSISNSIKGLNPVLVIKSIFSVPVEYFFTLLFLFIIVGIGLAEQIFIAYIKIPYVTPIISTFLSIYFATVEMRLLGLLIYCNRERFDWSV